MSRVSPPGTSAHINQLLERYQVHERVLKASSAHCCNCYTPREHNSPLFSFEN